MQNLASDILIEGALRLRIDSLKNVGRPLVSSQVPQGCSGGSDDLGRLCILNFGRQPAVSAMTPQHLNGLELQRCRLDAEVFQAGQMWQHLVCDVIL